MSYVNQPFKCTHARVRTSAAAHIIITRVQLLPAEETVMCRCTCLFFENFALPTPCIVHVCACVCVCVCLCVCVCTDFYRRMPVVDDITAARARNTL